MVPCRRRLSGLLLAIVASACAGDRSADTETWGFVATLGSDTTSVERITRTGNRISGDAIGRSPTLVRRRWEATLASDGTISSWTMDTEIPSAPDSARHLHHELHVREGSLRIVRQAGSDTSDRTVRSPYARTVPWNAFLYGSFEPLLNAAGPITDTTRVGIYFFEGWAEGNLGWALLRPAGGGRIGVRSSGLSGEGMAQVDSSGRLVSYSGEGTTYKQEVRRVEEVPDLEALLVRFASDERTRGAPRALSTRDTMRAAVGGANVAVDYSRPLARGRTLVGALIPYDRVWRTGANAATQLMIDAPVRLGGVALEPGTYTLWTLPTRDGVQLIINRQTGQWGTGYAAQHDIARVPMLVEATTSNVEQFTIRVDDAASRLLMEWGAFRWSVPIEPAR